MLVKGRTDGGVLGLLVPGLDALDATGAGERFGSHIGADSRLVVMILVALAAVQHLNDIG